MTPILLEGFDQYDTGSISAAEVVSILAGVTPDLVTDWFDESGASLAVVDDESRKPGGQSLEFVRVSGSPGSFCRDDNVNIGWAFTSKARLTCGAGFKWSTVPTEAVPIMQLRYDGANGDEEQISIWITPTGRVFASTEDITPRASDQITPGIITDTDTPSRTVRFTAWNYIEFLVDYVAGVPFVSIGINGETIVDEVANALLRKASAPLISSVHFINAATSFFGDDGYTMWLDDIFVSTGSSNTNQLRGPQNIVWLGLGGVISSNSWTSIAANPTNPNAFLLYSLDDLPGGIENVTAYSVEVFAENTSTEEQTGMSFGPQSGTNAATFLPKRISIGALESVHSRKPAIAMPGTLQLTPTGINTMNIRLAFDPVL
jgi:hypothetical protein